MGVGGFSVQGLGRCFGLVGQARNKRGSLHDLSWKLFEFLEPDRKRDRFAEVAPDFSVVSREKRELEGVQCQQHGRWALHGWRPRTADLKPACSLSWFRFLGD